ncbi:MAG: LysR family transcriptional regulator [Pseudomonadota bacterium]
MTIPEPSLRLDFGKHRVGPGKIALLEAIIETGSIRAAASALGVSYPKSSRLIKELNETFDGPIVVTRAGGSDRGGASVTPFGERLITAYRAAEVAVQDTVSGYFS